MLNILYIVSYLERNVLFSHSIVAMCKSDLFNSTFSRQVQIETENIVVERNHCNGEHSTLFFIYFSSSSSSFSFFPFEICVVVAFHRWNRYTVYNTRISLLQHSILFSPSYHFSQSVSLHICTTNNCVMCMIYIYCM